MRNKYLKHRRNARQRDIPFRLSFEQWLAIWNASGKLDQRGNQRGQYCMARFGDKGAYEIGNVSIVLIEDNRAERNQNYRMWGKNNSAFGKDYWALSNDLERKNRAAKISAAKTGKSKSDDMRKRLAQVATGRKMIVRDGRRTWAYPDHGGSF